MQQKKIILFLLILFIASSAWLFHASDKLTSPNTGKNWWTLSFANPTSPNLNFTIENHADQTAFHWEVLSNNQILQQGDATIKKGTSQNVTPTINSGAGKIVIDVTAGGDDKNNKEEIYKNL